MGFGNMQHMLYKKFFLIFFFLLPQHTYSLFPDVLLTKIKNNKVMSCSGILFTFVLVVFFLFYKNNRKNVEVNIQSKNNREKEKKAHALLVVEDNMLIKLNPVLEAIKTINKEDLEKGFKFFLDFLFASGISRNPHDKKTFPVINAIGTCLKNVLSQDEYIKLILFIVEKNYGEHNSILDWIIKTDLPLFFKKIDKNNNTLLHCILSQKRLSYHFLSTFDYLLKRIIKTDRALLNTKNNDGETILFALLQNPQFKYMCGYEWKYINALVVARIDVNTINNKKEHIFDLVLRVPELAQIELFWNSLNMPHYYDIPKYSPQDSAVREYFKEVRKNISVAADILKSFFAHFNTLHEFAKKVVKKDKGSYKNNSRETYIKSFWILKQTWEMIKSASSFAYIDWMFLESKERWIRKKEAMKKNLRPEQKVVDLDAEGLNYDVITKIYRTAEQQKPYNRLKELPNGNMDWEKYKPDPFYNHTIEYRWTKD